MYPSLLSVKYQRLKDAYVVEWVGYAQIIVWVNSCVCVHSIDKRSIRVYYYSAQTGLNMLCLLHRGLIYSCTV